MDPRVVLSWMAFAEVLGLIALALGGHGVAGLWTGVGVAGLAAFLHLTYLIQRRGAERMPEEFKRRRPPGLIPDHRRRLDRWVLSQWLAIAVVGGGGAALTDAIGAEPFDKQLLVYNVLSVGWVVLWSGVYLSSVVDWFLIMPKVSGISCPGPCERPGRQRWAGLTALWCFHRGFARLLVPAVLVGSPTVLGALSNSGAGQAICFAIAAVFAVYLVDFEVQGKAALGYGLNPRRYVGDRVWLVEESPDAVTRTAAYLVDVSAEGGKFKYLEPDGRYTGRPFETKHDDEGPAIALPALNVRPRVEEAAAPCNRHCSGVNWYCYRNPLAHSQSTNTGDDQPRES